MFRRALPRQTKTDLIEEYAKEGKQHVTLQQGMEKAKALGMSYFPISTKSNYNVTPMFEDVAARCLGSKNAENEAAAAAVSASAPDKKEKKDKKDKSDKKDKKDKEEKEENQPPAPVKLDLKNPPPKKTAEKKSGGCAAV